MVTPDRQTNQITPDLNKDISSHIQRPFKRKKIGFGG